MLLEDLRHWAVEEECFPYLKRRHGGAGVWAGSSEKAQINAKVILFGLLERNVRLK